MAGSPPMGESYRQRWPSSTARTERRCCSRIQHAVTEHRSRLVTKVGHLETAGQPPHGAPHPATEGGAPDKPRLHPELQSVASGVVQRRTRGPLKLRCELEPEPGRT